MRQLYLIAGHRGTATGAKGIIDEGTETIALRNDIAACLRFQGINCCMDADKDNLTAVIRRINSEAKPQDIIIDFHFNAFDGFAHGSEILIRGAASSFEQQLAEQLVDATCRILGTKNRGVKSAKNSQHSRLAMLDDTRCNSILIEVCFCDNEMDAIRYNTHRQQLIVQLAQILARYAKQ